MGLVEAEEGGVRGAEPPGRVARRLRAGGMPDEGETPHPPRPLYPGSPERYPGQMTPDALARLHALAFTTPPPWSADSFADLLASPFTFLETAPDGRAFLLGRVIAGEAELLTLATDPAARRAGLARQLMARFEAGAQARGATEAFLEVAEDNAPARALYAACGYVRTGRRPGYYVAPTGEVIAALILCKSFA